MPPKRTSQSQRSAKRLKPICDLLKRDPLSEDVDYEAAETLEALLRVTPNDPRVQFEYALLLEKPSKSLPHFQKAVDLEPKSGEFQLGLANCLKKCGWGARCTCHGDSNIVQQVSQWSRHEKCAEIHIQLAFKEDSKNPDILVAQAQTLTWNDRAGKIEILRKALSLCGNHRLANFQLAKMLRPSRWKDTSKLNMKDVAEARICAQKALSFSPEKKEKAEMHDIIAVCAMKQQDFTVARKHFEAALVTDPVEDPRNYHHFLKNRTQDKALYSIVHKFKQSFSVREGVTVANFFDRYALLTPGYRALLKKNNRTALVLMNQYAEREIGWILLIHPFNDEDFPKVVTRAIMDFLFHI